MYTIRPADAADAAAIAAIYAPIVSDTVISFELDPPASGEIAQRISAGCERFPWLVLTRDADTLGYAYAGAFRARPAYQWTAETTVYTHPDARRIGVGRALVTALLDCLRAQGFARAVAGVTLPNAGSVALHERAGFTPVGVFAKVGFKFGAWHDVGFWEQALGASGVAPATPRIWREMRERPEIGAILAGAARSVRPGG